MSCKDLRLGPRITFQQDTNPNHAAKAILKWFKGKHLNVLNDLLKAQTSIQLRICGMKIAVHQRNPSNLKELKQFCLEECAEIPVARCAKLIDTYPKRLAAVIAAKGGSTKY